MVKPINYSTDNKYVTYEDLVESLEYEVLKEERFGDYEGDLLFVLRDGGKYGYVVIGYGSCSGCDNLEGRLGYDGWTQESHEAVTELRDEIHRSIRWADSLEDLLTLMTPEQTDIHWYGNDDECKSIFARLRTELKEMGNE